jgi:small subunit ribosomal protein S10
MVRVAQLSIRAYDVLMVETAVAHIRGLASKHSVALGGTIPLPTKIQKITVNRSPVIDKASREQFETRTHQRLIEVKNTDPAIVK